MTELDSSPTLVESADFVVRPATSDDLNYVRKTWLQVHAQSSSFIDAVGGGFVYFREHAQLRDAAIERGAVTIACRANVPSGICGFAVTDDGIVHFVYVKPRWRRLGVAKLLLAPLAEKAATYTHRTWMCGCVQNHRPEQCPAPVAIQRLLPVPKAWTFNPYPFLRGSQ